ncbi:MAG TPA: Mth938-like domain-containing protein [Pseudorhodoplanes sp.]|nr:Mth938-like domain-containing protein [Pseudorhodoplanes sp.]
MTPSPEAPHFPRPVPIDSYGKGGFRFAGMSHRGSLLCLPSGIWAWPVKEAAEISEESLVQVFADTGEMSLFFLGTGHAPAMIAPSLRQRFSELKLSLEVMRTAHAANTYNILLGEGRRVGAALIAVD